MESFWFNYDSTLIDQQATQCFNFTNQTDFLFDTLRQIHDNIIESSQQSFQRIVRENIPSINQIIQEQMVVGRCDFNGSEAITQWLTESSQIFLNSKIDFIPDTSGFQNPEVYINNTDWYAVIDNFIL